MASLESAFKLTEHGTNVRTELIAGLTTYLTMAYIIFVNPSILGAAGMPKEAVFVATCLIAALGTGIMALYANYPIALAPGMGLNAYFAFVVVLQMGFTWQAALGAVFISGCLFLLVTLIARCWPTASRFSRARCWARRAPRPMWRAPPVCRRAGGRTGLTALTVAVLSPCCFRACLFIAPLAGSVPAYATAPALFFVACLMLRELTELDWDESTEVIPTAITALMMPFTYSIANGLAFGFISHALIKLFTGNARDVHGMTWLVGAVFLFKFIYIGGH